MELMKRNLGGRQAPPVLKQDIAGSQKVLERYTWRDKP